MRVVIPGSCGDVKCMACRKSFEVGEEAEQIVYGGRSRFIHPHCTGKNHPEMHEWNKLIEEDRIPKGG